MSRMVCIAACALIVAACATPRWKQPPHDRYFQRESTPRLHRLPEVRKPSEWWDMLWHTAIRPAGEGISPGHHLRRAAGNTEAMDVNAFGQVPDSSWFENRIGHQPMTIEEMARGPNTLPGPAPGPLAVLDGKTEGATPGFIVRDSHGQRWMVKFDPPAFPEMASGAEVLSTKLLHAAGYHVPQNRVEVFNLERLVLSPRATTVDDYNRTIPFTRRKLIELVTQLNPRPDGTIRALFSRIIPGELLGPFSYQGTRADDPNDRIPHEHRRSLRGLWVFAALLNHSDANQINSLDTFITVDRQRGLGFIRHYLLDFGSTMGSGGTDLKPLYTGYSHLVDWPIVGKRLVALGLYYPYWLSAQKSPYRSIGMFEAEVFDPARWRPVYANPAFDRATPGDTFWAAAILARLDPELIAAAVKSARFSEPGAASWVTQTLIKRREKLLRYAFGPVLALDRPAVKGGYRLSLVDLDVQTGLVARGKPCYRWQARHNRSGASDRVLASGATRVPALDLAEIVRKVRQEQGRAFDRDPFLTVTWWRSDRRPRVEVHLRVLCDRILPVGLWREVR